MNPTDTDLRLFEKRKADHIRLSLAEETEAIGLSGFDSIQLIHEALPELDFARIQLDDWVLGYHVRLPLMISGMTAGHDEALGVNLRLARACAKRGWWMGVGSQRRQLTDPEAIEEMQALRKEVPDVHLLGNLGISQAINISTDVVQELVESTGAVAMVIHTNPLQECMQSEGTPQFRGGFEGLRRLSEELSVPVILKETGCGISQPTLQKLRAVKLGAVDVSGFGGTHWGRVEGARADAKDVRREASHTFANWGISTVESLLGAKEVAGDFEIWASGGVRSGLDAAKAIALGAKMVGFAKPALVAALQGEEALDRWMERMEFELKTALFCTGCGSIKTLRERQVWQWQKL